jgi:hypothetical protein
MSIRIWSLVLSLTLLTAAPAIAKRHHADEAGDKSAAGKTESDPTAKSTQSGTPALDDLLDGQIPPTKASPVPADGLVDIKPKTVEENSTKEAVSEPAAGSSVDFGNGSSAANSQEPASSRPAPAPQPRSPLQATIRRSALGADANEYNGVPLDGNMAPRAPLQGKADQGATRLHAEQNDPDVEDRELMIEWDRWRNRFLRAVQMQVQLGVNHPDDFGEDVRPRFDPRTGMHMARFPLGTETWFDCEITSDRRIKNLAIVRPSGIQEYDRAVIEGVRALEGTSILIFPRGSRRPVVQQKAGIRTSDRADFQYHHFGDVERYREPGQ